MVPVDRDMYESGRNAKKGGLPICHLVCLFDSRLARGLFLALEKLDVEGFKVSLTSGQYRIGKGEVAIGHGMNQTGTIAIIGDDLDRGSLLQKYLLPNFQAGQ